MPADGQVLMRLPSSSLTVNAGIDQFQIRCGRSSLFCVSSGIVALFVKWSQNSEHGDAVHCRFVSDVATMQTIFDQVTQRFAA